MDDLECLKEIIKEEFYRKEPYAAAIIYVLETKYNIKIRSEVMEISNKIIDNLINEKISEYREYNS